MNDGYIAQDDRGRGLHIPYIQLDLFSLRNGWSSGKFIIKLCTWELLFHATNPSEFIVHRSTVSIWVIFSHILSHCLTLLDWCKMQELGFPHFLIHSHPHLSRSGISLAEWCYTLHTPILFGSNCNCVPCWLPVTSWIVAGQQGSCAGGCVETELCKFRQICSTLSGLPIEECHLVCVIPS